MLVLKSLLSGNFVADNAISQVKVFGFVKKKKKSKFRLPPSTLLDSEVLTQLPGS